MTARAEKLKRISIAKQATARETKAAFESARQHERDAIAALEAALKNIYLGKSSTDAAKAIAAEAREKREAAQAEAAMAVAEMKTASTQAATAAAAAAAMQSRWKKAEEDAKQRTQAAEEEEEGEEALAMTDDVAAETGEADKTAEAYQTAEITEAVESMAEASDQKQQEEVVAMEGAPTGAAEAATEEVVGGAFRAEPQEAEPTTQAAAARASLLDAAPSDNAAVDDEVRAAKVAERDAALRLALGRGRKQPQTVRAALGMTHAHFITDAEVKKRALYSLRLLHPDYSLNLALKGTKKYAQIEAAFKRLSALRDASEQAVEKR